MYIFNLKIIGNFEVTFQINVGICWQYLILIIDDIIWSQWRKIVWIWFVFVFFEENKQWKNTVFYFAGWNWLSTTEGAEHPTILVIIEPQALQLKCMREKNGISILIVVLDKAVIVWHKRSMLLDIFHFEVNLWIINNMWSIFIYILSG